MPHTNMPSPMKKSDAERAFVPTTEKREGDSSAIITLPDSVQTATYEQMPRQNTAIVYNLMWPASQGMVFDMIELV
ncbi:hypothetical protein PM082_011650 [Marasmius tenuissimus]|nr:hypothetical protein PM082_011650 [Marasmius tenuissimus]